MTENNQTQRSFCCPLPQTALWDQHPRVYLAMDKTGSAVCPYCGTVYPLEQNNLCEKKS